MNGAMLLPEFDNEMATTRRVLERIPDGQLDFKPHPKSFSMLELATHITNIPSWTGVTLTSTELDLARDWAPGTPKSRDEILAAFDATVAEARGALESATSDDLMVGWTLKNGEKTHFTMPRAAVLRSFVLSHLIHHRAQLGVYLRLVDVPVPSVYGPTADEPM